MSTGTEGAPYAEPVAAANRGWCAIGLMSGTSMDGIDVAALRTDGEGLIERGPAREYAFDASQRRRLEAAIERGGRASNRDELRAELADLERDVTDWHAAAVERFERETGFAAELVGFHGQTVAHRPAGGWTLQLGDGARLATALGRDVAFDFRSADMARGGEGAPLVPVYHRGLAAALFAAGEAGPIAFLNVGGVANVTVLERGAVPVAFDCGPGNMLIDRWVQREVGVPLDQGGRIASEGRIVRDYVAEMLAAPFFERTGPRSLDRLDFGLPAPGRMDPSDGARTLTRLTAEAVGRSLAALERAPRLVLVCGGGRLNDLLMADLREVLSAEVEPAEARDFDGGAMEAEAFAYLAVRAARGLASTYPSTTGARESSVAGRLVRP